MEEDALPLDWARTLTDALLASSCSANTPESISPWQSRPDPDLICRDTYILLCHDDPVGLTADGCWTLAESLQRMPKTRYNNSCSSAFDNSSSPKAIRLALAPCDRLLQGLHQAVLKIPESAVKGVRNDGNTEASHLRSSQDAELELSEKKLSLSVQGAEPMSLMDSSRDASNSDALNPALAYLYYVVHVRIPLLILMLPNDDSSLSMASSYLGSLTNISIPDTVEPPQWQCDQRLGLPSCADGTEHEELTIHQDLDSPIPVLNLAGASDAEFIQQESREQDSIEEIWAAESDPSDYAYESDYSHAEQIAALDTWAIQVESTLNDPVALSQPESQGVPRGWQDIALLVRCVLLDSCRYSPLAAIDGRVWERRKLSADWTQLILMMILPTACRSPIMNLSCRREKDYGDDNAAQQHQQQHQQHQQYRLWQQTGMHLLNVFRDFVWHSIFPQRYHGRTGSGLINNNSVICDDNNAWLLQDYMLLMQTILEVYESNDYDCTRGKRRTDDPTAIIYETAIWVGVSALSALSSQTVDMLGLANRSAPLTNPHHAAAIVAVIQKTILNASDILASLLEHQQASLATTKDTNSDRNQRHSSAADWVAVEWSYLGLFQILVPFTGVISTNQAVMRQSRQQESVMPISQAQVLLNSGLFQQWLIFVSHETPGKDDDGVCQLAVNTNLLYLCAASPTLLGKFTWRFPGLARKLTQVNLCTVRSGACDCRLFHAKYHDKADQSLEREQIGRRNDEADKLPSWQSLLWNLLGMHFEKASSQQSSTGGSMSVRVVWKHTSKGDKSKCTKTMGTPSFSDCQQAFWSGFQAVSQRVGAIFVKWKRSREVGNGNDLSPDMVDLLTIESWIHLANALASISLVQSLFFCEIVHAVAEPNGNRPASVSSTTLEPIASQLQRIQQILVQWPSRASDSASMDRKADTDERKGENTQPTRQPSSLIERVHVVSAERADAAVANLRKAIKTLDSLAESFEMMTKTDSKGSENTMHSFSSKAD